MPTFNLSRNTQMNSQVGSSSNLMPEPEGFSTAPEIPEETPVTTEEATQIVTPAPEVTQLGESLKAFAADDNVPTPEVEQQEVTQELETAVPAEEQAVAENTDTVTEDEELPPPPEMIDVESPEEVVETATTTAEFAQVVNDRCKHIIHKRATADELSRSVVVRGIYNRTLRALLADFNRTYGLDESLLVTGTIIKKTKSCGIWDEGGATVEDGSVLIATDNFGRKIAPVSVMQDTDNVNGKHALVPINVGYYLLMGGHRHGIHILSIYRVVTVTPITPEQQNPKFDCELVAYVQGDKWNQYKEDDTTFSLEHPAVIAAMNRMYEMHALTPGYVNDYREHYLDLGDFNRALQDTEFQQKAVTLSLDEAYTQVREILGRHVPEMLGTTKHCLETIYLVDYNSYVVVFVLGLIYDYEAKSSEGGRLVYSRTILHDGDKFWYPDTPETVLTYDQIKTSLVAAKGSLITTLRHMTRIQYL